MLWCEYWLRNRQHRESTLTSDPEEAQDFLDHRLMELGADVIGARQFIPPSQRKMRVGKLLDDLEADYVLRNKASGPFLSHLKAIRAAFAEWPAVEVTRSAVDRYIIAEREAQTADATVNRRLQLLSQAFTLAVQSGDLLNAPHIRHLSEIGNERRGFFGEVEFRQVLAHLPTYLQDYVLFAYLTGWRAGECASVRWEDFDDDTIHLRAEESKNRVARQIPIIGELTELMKRRRAARVVTTPSGSAMLADLIFHCEGQPIGDYRKSWATACVKAGIGRFVCRHCEQPVAIRKCEKCNTDDVRYEGRVFHDLRRTAVRNMVRAGVSQNVAMQISGHKTRSIFDRYNITSREDLQDAMKRTHEYLRNREQRQPIILPMQHAQNSV